MPKHIHADLMMQYAKDAMETDKPWEMWEVYSEVNDRWVQLNCQAMFDEQWQYRRKPDVIKINGFEVPAPLRVAPELGTMYYILKLDEVSLFDWFSWEDTICDYRLLHKGIVHLTKEAAIAHAKALLSFTEIKD